MDEPKIKALHLDEHQILMEEKCEKCTEAENKLDLDGPTEPSMTKRDSRRLERSLYRKMVDDGFLRRLVDKVATFCPKKSQDLAAYAQLLVSPMPGEAVDLNSRYKAVVKLDETIRNMTFSKEDEIPLELRLDAIAKEILEDMRQRQKKEICPSNSSDVKSVTIKEHVCNKRCPWCQLHCENLSAVNQMTGKKCNGNCVIIEPLHQCRT